MLALSRLRGHLGEGSERMLRISFLIDKTWREALGRFILWRGFFLLKSKQLKGFRKSLKLTRYTRPLPFQAYISIKDI